MRALALAAVAALALAGCAGGRDAAPLLPDLDQAAPAAVGLRRERGRSLLVFASAVDNVGRGALVLDAARDPGAAAMRVRQRVTREDASVDIRPVDAVLRYERAETHAHWHLMGFERYELRRPDGTPAAAARKAGFCLGDRYDSRGSVRLAGEPRDAVWTDECGRGRPGLRRLSEGISVGYGDDYVPRLESQYMDVTDLAPGRYVLVHVANPGRALREADYGNNAASVLLELDAGRLRVVARCPASATCAG